MKKGADLFFNKTENHLAGLPTSQRWRKIQGANLDFCCEEAVMKFCGIDLYSNNSVVVVTDETDRVLVSRRCPNELAQILPLLEPHRGELLGVVVESTYNWYWLVDGLKAAGFEVKLANPVAMQRYNGLTHSDDKDDAAFLAHLLRLGILPTGYNTKSGNAYLIWAFIEAVNFARRFSEGAKRFFEKKKAKTNTVVATKALAHKLARASYHILKEKQPFDAKRCFA